MKRIETDKHILGADLYEARSISIILRGAILLLATSMDVPPTKSPEGVETKGSGFGRFPSGEYREDGKQQAIGSGDQCNAWSLYNESALEYDRQMMKEWVDALSVLLIFVGIQASSIRTGWY
jgi:hypothetical protein